MLQLIASVTISAGLRFDSSRVELYIREINQAASSYSFLIEQAREKTRSSVIDGVHAHLLRRLICGALVRRCSSRQDVLD
ncbi:MULTISPECIES: hypothetical protein [Rhodanobacteraceae]|uniref:hypothetical protein n=1 Tax=Rhodanobacteraceae TaxID=1775411 RepID=UPI0011171B4B|nr:MULTISPECIES: hypothetical protein [Rhodanobacteraceae]